MSLSEQIVVTNKMALSGGGIAGIVAGGVAVLVVLVLFLVRQYHRGVTKGSDNPKRLDNKIVVITGT